MPSTAQTERAPVEGAGAAGNNDRPPRGAPTLDGDRVYVLTGTATWRLKRMACRGNATSFRLRRPRDSVADQRVASSWDQRHRYARRTESRRRADEAVGQDGGRVEIERRGGCASPVAADVQGVRVIMTLTSRAGVGVRVGRQADVAAATVPNGTANVATPIFHDNKVFTSNYGTGAALLGLTGRRAVSAQIYFTEMQNHHGGLVLVDGYLWLPQLDLTCLEFATGKAQWRDRSVGKGTLSTRTATYIPERRQRHGTGRAIRRPTRRRAARRRPGPAAGRIPSSAAGGLHPRSGRWRRTIKAR
jgi:hypothetical protein